MMLVPLHFPVKEVNDITMNKHFITRKERNFLMKVDDIGDTVAYVKL